MAIVHGLHLPHWHVGVRRRSAEVVASDDPGVLTDRVVAAGFVLGFAAWLTAFVAILNLSESQLRSGPAALWTAVAIGSAIGIFLLGIWKAHRA